MNHPVVGCARNTFFAQFERYGAKKLALFPLEYLYSNSKEKISLRIFYEVTDSGSPQKIAPLEEPFRDRDAKRKLELIQQR